MTQTAPGRPAMTATSTTALNLLDNLVRIDSVNPGLDPPALARRR